MRAMSDTPPQRTVSIRAAHTSDALRELIVPVLERDLAGLSADPLIATESPAAGLLPAGAARWIERVASRRGYMAEKIDAGSGIVLECGHPAPKLAVTELHLEPDPGLTEQLYAIGIWSRFVSRRRKWTMRFTPTLMAEIVANAACADPILTVQVARWRNIRLAVIATDLIAAEVTGRALRSVLQPAGDIGETPWQAPIVQAAVVRRLGVVHGHDMSISAVWSGPETYPDWLALRTRLVRVSHLIDCELTVEAT